MRDVQEVVSRAGTRRKRRGDGFVDFGNSLIVRPARAMTSRVAIHSDAALLCLTRTTKISYSV